MKVPGKRLWLLLLVIAGTLVGLFFSDLDDRIVLGAWERQVTQKIEEAVQSLTKPSDSSLDILVLVLDTVRYDALFSPDANRPRPGPLADFFNRALTFSQAYSTSCWTLPAHASLMSGLYPNRHRADQENTKIGTSFPVLAEKLKQNGYVTFGMTENPWVGSSSGIARGFDVYFDAYRGLSSLSLKDPKGLMTFLGLSRLKTRFTPRLVETICSHPALQERPLFLFVNLLDPHRPYMPMPENYSREKGDSGYWRAIHTQYRYNVRTWYTGKAAPDKQNLETLRRLYDAEVREVASKARRILDAWKRRGKKQIVFLLSDHGENFGEGGHLDHVFTLRQSAVRTVLAVRGDGILAGHSTRPTSLVDIFPTALQRAGILPPENDGQDLFAPQAPDRPIFLSYAFPREVLGLFSPEERDSLQLKPYRSPIDAVIHEGWKLVRSPNRKARLFRPEQDPNETNDLSEVHSQIADSLTTLLDAYALRKVKVAGTASANGLDRATRESLKALGYIQ